MPNSEQHPAREFRKPESYVAENITRAMVAPFLRDRGFRINEDRRKRYGQNQAQTIDANDPECHRISMAVRLCWRQRSSRPTENFAAAQLLANIEAGDWLGTLTRKMDRESAEGKTHLLVIERVGNAICHAALIPISAVTPIWEKQRDTSQRLIDEGRLGSRKKNHAMNGSSPTLYLRDTKAQEVADALWTWPAVSDLAHLPLITQSRSDFDDDSLDDLKSFDFATLGSDGSRRVQRITSGVKRDPRVREAVIRRTGGTCENKGCGTHRDYPGFLDVHHILGAETSDRVWTCIALCPCCHRDAHASPSFDRINGEFLEFAKKFNTQPSRPPLPLA